MPKRSAVLVSGGQFVVRGDEARSVFHAPCDLAAGAARAALADAGITAQQAAIDAVAMVRLFADSSPLFASPFGGAKNPPRAVASRLGIEPQRAIYSHAGGIAPQQMVNEMIAAINAGEIDCALVCGAEAIAAQKLGKKAGAVVDWDEDSQGDMDDHGVGPEFYSSWEPAHGIGLPIYTYPLFENAIRHKRGMDRAQYRRYISELFVPFSKVAASNPYAQFPRAYSVDELQSTDGDNYWIADPLSKNFVAQDSVNQGAAVLIMSEQRAQQLNIPKKNWVYLHAAAESVDRFVSERPDLSTSSALKAVVKSLYEQCGGALPKLQCLDIYSCFPSAVIAACEALDIAVDVDGPQALTLTGGLPFFGGAGNNYSLHAIVETLHRLRGKSDAFGLVYSNGGYLSKHALGLYGTQKTQRDFSMQPSAVIAQESHLALPVAVEADGEAEIVTFTVAYAKGRPQFGIVIANLDSGERCVAVNGDAESMQALLGDEPIGRRIRVNHKDGKNFFKFD
jgi:acetyl-CoA C-acetyltransferase